MKKLIAIMILIAGTLPTLAVQTVTTLNLVNETGFNEIAITLDSGDLFVSGYDTTVLTGTIDVQLNVNLATGQTSELTVITGDVTGSGATFARSDRYGSLSLTSSATLGATLSTPSPPGVVDPPTGDFEAAQHSFVVNSGTLDGTATVVVYGYPLTSPVSIDFAAEPVSGEGEGTGTVSLVETGGTPPSKTYDVTVVLPISIINFIDVGGVLAWIRMTASGTVKASGSVTVSPSIFDLWATANGMPGALFGDDENGDGVPNGVQWALGLTAGDSPFAHLFQPTGNPGATIDFQIVLPPGGSAGDLEVLVSSNLTLGSFIPLASGAVSSGNPIPAGTTGTVTISLPATETKSFVQLLATEP